MLARQVFVPFLALLTLLGCSRDSSVEKPATSMSKAIPENGIAMSKDELAAKADIPLYPGADVPEGQSKVTPLSTETRYEINMFTGDPVSKVEAFYKDKLRVDKQGSNTAIDMMGMTPKGELAQIKIETKNGKTHIQAVSVDEKKS